MKVLDSKTGTENRTESEKLVLPRYTYSRLGWWDSCNGSLYAKMSREGRERHEVVGGIEVLEEQGGRRRRIEP